MRYLTRILVVWLSLAFFQTAAWSAEIYTWVDGKKVTHFSQFPPTGQSASKIPLHYQPAKNTMEAKGQIEALRKDAENVGEALQAPKQTLQQTKEEKAQIHLGCEKAKQELAFLQSASTPELTGNSGSPRLLTQTEKKQRLQAAQAQSDLYCD